MLIFPLTRKNCVVGKSEGGCESKQDLARLVYLYATNVYIIFCINSQNEAATQNSITTNVCSTSKKYGMDTSLYRRGY